MRTVYCRYPACRKFVDVLHTLPVICPHCLQPGQWSTRAPTLDEQLTPDDWLMLKSLRIRADGGEPQTVS